MFLVSVFLFPALALFWVESKAHPPLLRRFPAGVEFKAAQPQSIFTYARQLYIPYRRDGVSYIVQQNGLDCEATHDGMKQS